MAIYARIVLVFSRLISMTDITTSVTVNISFVLKLLINKYFNKKFKNKSSVYDNFFFLEI